MIECIQGTNSSSSSFCYLRSDRDRNCLCCTFMHMTLSAICKFFVFYLQPNYQPPFAPSAPPQPSVPSLFTPQPVPVMSVTPHHVVPSQASMGPQASVYSRGHPYPQYNLGLNPATVPGPGEHCLIVVCISRFSETKAFNEGGCSSCFSHRPIVLQRTSQLPKRLLSASEISSCNNCCCMCADTKHI